MSSPRLNISFIVINPSLFTEGNPAGSFALEDVYPNIKKYPVNNEYSFTDIILYNQQLGREKESPSLIWIAKTESDYIITTTIIQDSVEEENLSKIINNIATAFSTLRKVEN